MKQLFSICLFILFLFSNSLHSQQMKPVEVDSLIVASVKKDVWIPFMESYRDLDFKKLESIHSPDITRVSIDLNQIESGAPYLKNVGSFFERIKSLNYQMRITFSIVSSATTENRVYQTGYYTIGLRANDQQPFQSRRYSAFSVLLTKQNGSWKISFDSDKEVKLSKEEFTKSGTIYKL